MQAGLTLVQAAHRCCQTSVCRIDFVLRPAGCLCCTWTMTCFCACFMQCCDSTLQQNDAHGLIYCRLSAQGCGMQLCWHSCAQTISRACTSHGCGRRRHTANGRSMTHIATCNWLRELLLLVAILFKVCRFVCNNACSYISIHTLSGKSSACWCQLARCMHVTV